MRYCFTSKDSESNVSLRARVWIIHMQVTEAYEKILEPYQSCYISGRVEILQFLLSKYKDSEILQKNAWSYNDNHVDF